MANYLGSLSWGIVPLNWETTNLATMSWDYRANYLKSANDQLRYQVQWTKANLNEGVEPSASNFSGLPASGTVGQGDIVNAIFKVETTVDGTNWTTIGTIKKSRDIANKRYATGDAAPNHRFTIDISQLVSDQLSYSLCPINKGTWQSNYYGGMNGGAVMQDNVIGTSPISNYNVSENGTFRRVKVSVTFDIINGNGEITDAGYTLSPAPYITAINSVNQFERNSLYYNNSYNVSDSATNKYQFLTRCPNWSDGSIVQDFKKPVRIDEQAEWLQFYIRKNYSDQIRGTGLDSVVGAVGIKIVTTESDGLNNTFYLRDFEDNILTGATNSGYTVQSNYQNQMFIQNISPDYIINSGNVWNPATAHNPAPSSNYPYWSAYTGDTITDNTISYTAYLVKIGMWYTTGFLERRVTKYYKYTIDRESENIPYGFVRFHWLNSMGAIDSYTAKRDVVEGLTISRSVVERNSADRTWYQANSSNDNGSESNPLQTSFYVSDTMRGGNLYKGGREVSNVNADKVQSVYTEPLNKSVAKWLEEMLLSPNVWIEKDTAATARGNSSNPYLRPSTKGYIPVIITNSDAETVNQAEGLVKFNIEYTLAHKVQTQRN